MRAKHPFRLRNRYVLVRHGESTANANGKIAGADPRSNGLTQNGRRQVRDNFLKTLKKLGHSDRKFVIYASPLSRTLETAAIISHLVDAPVHIDGRLIERKFGCFEGKDISNYQIVWDKDARGESVEACGVEDLSRIASRAQNLISETEATLSGAIVVMCTHGDVASTVIALLMGVPLTKHRQIGAMETGENYLI